MPNLYLNVIAGQSFFILVEKKTDRFFFKLIFYPKKFNPIIRYSCRPSMLLRLRQYDSISVISNVILRTPAQIPSR